MTCFCSTELTFSWIFDEYPSFVKQDSRRFVSQKTGNLYIAKVEPSDAGNYTCVVTNMVTKTRVQGPPASLVLRSDGNVATLYLSDQVLYAVVCLFTEICARFTFNQVFTSILLCCLHVVE